MKGEISENEKNCFNVIINTLFFISLLLLFRLSVQNARLESDLAKCRQYREQLELAKSRESKIRDSISRTSVILSSTGNEVANLRKKLEALENNYNYLYNMYCVDNNTMENK